LSLPLVSVTLVACQRLYFGTERSISSHFVVGTENKCTLFLAFLTFLTVDDVLEVSPIEGKRSEGMSGSAEDEAAGCAVAPPKPPPVEPPASAGAQGLGLVLAERATSIVASRSLAACQ
jgi:hypothetical protein